MNSIKNKFPMIAEMITNFDIFLILEPTVDSIFPNMQFKTTGYKLLTLDHNRFGGKGGLMLYLNEEIPCKVLNIYTVVKLSYSSKCRNNLHLISSIKT